MQKVLLIDDSKSIHPLVASLLEEEQVTIHSAFDAQSGLLLAESLRPDLVLLDVEMPGFDGYAACQSLKANPSTAGLPVVFLTARSATDSIVRGLNLGAMDYVAKPFQPSEFLSRVRAALRTSHLIRLLEEKATIDALTGLGNRAMLEDRLAAELAMRVRTHSELSCIVLDVDRFKAINDRFGHPFGDQVLRTIGQRLVDICRREDVACRQGGEEFAILTPQTSASHAALLAERMRIAISETPFARGGEKITVTCSFGVAEATDTYDRRLLQRADQALYQSKSRGGHCVSIAPQSDARAIAA